MKKIILALSVLSILACSDDESGTTSNENNTAVAFPQSTGDYWLYDVQTDDLPIVTDSLYINGDIQADGNTYITYKSNDTGVASGFYTGSLNNNGIRTDGNQYKLNGTLGIGAEQQLPINLSFNLNDFIMFDSGADSGVLVDEVEGSEIQTVSGLELTITYTLKSVAGESLANYTRPDGTSYQNVRSHKINVDLAITTPLLGNTASIINQPNALQSTQYYADNIGMVYSTLSFDASVNPLVASFLPDDFPAEINFTQTENLTDYLIN